MIEMENKKIKYLNRIKSPEDVKELSSDCMPEVAAEIREELVRIVSKNGGHLSSNLGVVELTMAIHRVFDSPSDHIIFDVGHQSYVHKMLTGRYEDMDTLRQSGGIGGFTNRAESEHDCFGAGHSSTSLSAALGFAISDKLNDSSAYTVAVVGDGAYTGGMIHEALNNCRKDLNLVIILNENEMSISENTGLFAQNLSKLRTSPGYFKVKRTTVKVLTKIPLLGKGVVKVGRAVKRMIKNVLYGSNYFESMGLTYLGPIDGHNYDQVEYLLNEAKKLHESVVVHVKTVKGKGYEPAEKAPEIYHSMPPENAQRSDENNFSHTMGHIISDIAATDNRICAITAAMCDGTGLQEFKEKYPDRFFDVGIAEEHALTFAAGLAANGMRPVVAIYSTFLQRGFDNIIHDIALQKLPVIMCVDRAGLNPADGATHHGIFDVAFLSQIPNIKIYTPITNAMLEVCIKRAVDEGAPCVIRYPNECEDASVLASFYDNEAVWKIARCNYTIEDTPSKVIITHGRMVKTALEACEILKRKGIETGVILLEVLKPYGQTADAIVDILPKHCDKIVLLEEEIYSGGMGMNLYTELMSRDGVKNADISIIAINDSFVTKRNKGDSIYRSAEIDIDNIIKVIEEQ